MNTYVYIIIGVILILGIAFVLKLSVYKGFDLKKNHRARLPFVIDVLVLSSIFIAFFSLMALNNNYSALSVLSLLLAGFVLFIVYYGYLRDFLYVALTEKKRNIALEKKLLAKTGKKLDVYINKNHFCISVLKGKRHAVVGQNIVDKLSEEQITNILALYATRSKIGEFSIYFISFLLYTIVYFFIAQLPEGITKQIVILLNIVVFFIFIPQGLLRLLKQLSVFYLKGKISQAEMVDAIKAYYHTLKTIKKQKKLSAIKNTVEMNETISPVYKYL